MTNEKQKQILNKKSFNFFYAMGKWYCMSNHLIGFRYIESKMSAKTIQQENELKIKVYKAGIVTTILITLFFIGLIGSAIMSII